VTLDIGQEVRVNHLGYPMTGWVKEVDEAGGRVKVTIKAKWGNQTIKWYPVEEVRVA